MPSGGPEGRALGPSTAAIGWRSDNPCRGACTSCSFASMAKALVCPNCGAPLEPDGSGVVECNYCERHIVLGAGGAPARPPARAAASAPAPAETDARKTSKRGRASRLKLTRPVRTTLAATIMLVVLGAIWWRHTQTMKAASNEVKGEELARKLELTATPDEVAALFGPAMHPNARPNDVTIDFPLGQGAIRRMELHREFPGHGQISDVTVYFNKYDKAATLARIREVAPNRLQAQNAGSDRVFMGDAVLDLAPTYIKIWHWDSVHPANGDYALCAQRIAAYWSLARWAALDGPAPTPEEVKLVNGPTLADLAKLDTSATVEQAVDAFHRHVPSGWCRMQAGLMCVADIDDPLVTEARWGWPNGLRARIHEGKLTFNKRDGMDKLQRAVAGCLQATLGAGEEVVVDYVKGTRNFVWKNDDGSSIILGERELALTSGEGPIDKPAAWLPRFAAIMSALDSCSP